MPAREHITMNDPIVVQTVAAVLVAAALSLPVVACVVLAVASVINGAGRLARLIDQWRTRNA